MRKIKLFVIYCLPFFILSAGCAGLSGQGAKMTNPILEPQAMTRFNDIPIPWGFKLVPQDSYAFENAGMRVALLKYQGKANPDLVVNFYKEQMDMYNWNLINIIEYGQRMLNFERDNESCIINMQVKGNNITITISLGPKSQMPVKKAEKPLK